MANLISLTVVKRDNVAAAGTKIFNVANILTVEAGGAGSLVWYDEGKGPGFRVLYDIDEAPADIVEAANAELIAAA